MSEQKVRIVIKFLVGETVPSAEIHHRLQQQYEEECLRRRHSSPYCRTARKPVYMPTGLILNKKGMCLPHVSSILKKISPKTFVPHCVFAATLHIGGRYTPNMNHSPSQLKHKFWAKKIN